MGLLDIEQGYSTQFYTAYLNNTRAFIKLFNGVIYKEQFIMLPGDEIVEKKHKNVKHLIAMDRNEDMSKRATRKFPGLGPSVFQIDFEKQFSAAYGDPDATPEAEGQAEASKLSRPPSSKLGKRPPSPKKGGKDRPASPTASQKGDGEGNELSAEVEIQNTLHHKAIVKARNENYLTFKKRFQLSISQVMTRFDEERKEELRFQEYWNENLKEITVKHI